MFWQRGHELVVEKISPGAQSIGENACPLLQYPFDSLLFIAQKGRNWIHFYVLGLALPRLVFIFSFSSSWKDASLPSLCNK